MSSTAWMVLLAATPALAVALHRYVVCVAIVQSESMEPTMSRGDRLVVSRVAYLLAQPRQGDIVVFVSPDHAAAASRTRSRIEGRRWLVKRIAAIEGAAVPGGDEVGATVPPGFLFLAGDNEAVSRDSRQFGPVPRGQIVGKALLTYGARRRVRRL